MITVFLSKVANNSTVGVTNTNFFKTQYLSFSHKYTSFYMFCFNVNVPFYEHTNSKYCVGKHHETFCKN